MARSALLACVCAQRRAVVKDQVAQTSPYKTADTTPALGIPGDTRQVNLGNKHELRFIRR